MKKIITLLLFFSMFSASLSAQNYNNSIGVRIGGDNAAIAFKTRLGSNAFEAHLAIPWNSGFNVTGLYEWTTPVISSGFNLYYGAGAHIGVYHSDFVLGIDAVVGLEYKVPGAPIAFSLDYKPYVNLIPEVEFRFWDFSLGIKFTF